MRLTQLRQAWSSESIEPCELSGSKLRPRTDLLLDLHLRSNAFEPEGLDAPALSRCAADADERGCEVEPAVHSVDDDQERRSQNNGALPWRPRAALVFAFLAVCILHQMTIGVSLQNT